MKLHKARILLFFFSIVTALSYAPAAQAMQPNQPMIPEVLWVFIKVFAILCIFAFGIVTFWNLLVGNWKIPEKLNNNTERAFRILKYLIPVTICLLVLMRFGTLWVQEYRISDQHISFELQTSYLPGQPAVFDVSVVDEDTSEPLQPKITMTLLSEEKGVVAVLFDEKLEEQQTQFTTQIPNDAKSGSYVLQVEVDSNGGNDILERKISIANDGKLLLTTDRPLYKPGQTLLFRGLVLSANDLTPLADETATVTVIDPNGNKIFQKDYDTSSYGVFSGELPLADRITTGDYEIVAKSAGLEFTKQLEIKPFALPKFKVVTEGGLENGDAYRITDYLTDISILVKPQHFYGEPLQNPEFDLMVEAYKSPSNVRSVKLEDPEILEDGTYKFDAAVEHTDIERIEVKGSVVDSDGNEVVVAEGFSLAEESLQLALIPEAGELKAGIENIVYVVSSYGDGTPAPVEAFVSGTRIREFATDEFGVGSFTFTPEEGISEAIVKLTATDDNGGRFEESVEVAVEQTEKTILLRPKQIAVQQEEGIEVEVFAKDTTDEIRVDLIQNQKVLHTQVVTLKEGQASATFDVPKGTFGAMMLQAVEVTDNRSRNTAADQRVIMIDNSKNLNVAVTPNKETFKPGEEMSLNMAVTDDEGNKESAALGVSIVDEALLALSNDKALSKTFFLINEDLRAKAGSVNGIGLERAVVDTTLQARDVMLRAILADVRLPSAQLVAITVDHHQSKRAVHRELRSLVNFTRVFIMIAIGIFFIIFLWHGSAHASKKSLLLPAWCLSLIPALLALISIASLFGFGYRFELSDAFELPLRLIVELASMPYIMLLLTVIFSVLSFGFAYLMYKETDRRSSFDRSLLAILALTTAYLLLHSYDGFDSLEYRAQELSFALILLLFLLAYVTCLFGIGSANSISSKVFRNYTIALFCVTCFLPHLIFYIITPVLAFFGIIRSIAAVPIDDVTTNAPSTFELKAERDALVAKKNKTAAENVRLGELNLLLSERAEPQQRIDGWSYSGLVLLIILGIPFLLFVMASVTRQSSSTIERSPSQTRINDRSSFRGDDPFGLSASTPMGVSESARMDGIMADSAPFFDFDVPSFGIMDSEDSAPPPTASVHENQRFMIGAASEPAAKQQDFKEAERVRKYFPETMFWEPNIIAENGEAEVMVPMADSITGWNISALANSLSGRVGSGSAGITTFQEFFVDFDLPATLIEGDELTIPVRIFNYLEQAQEIKIIVRNDDWFELNGDYEQILSIDAKAQVVVPLEIRVTKSGDFTFRIDANGTAEADAIQKSAEVKPFGRKIQQTAANEPITEAETEMQAIFPKTMIGGTEALVVKVVPTMLAEIVEGIEGIFRLPSGCFEQISSSLHPNILALQYLEKSGKDNAEIRARAEDYINKGKQKILTYENGNSGGFSLYGRGQAETILTAYGLMQFSEMAEVSFVDAALLTRMTDFVYKDQNNDGSFRFHGSRRGGFTGGGDLFAKNAYVIWALSETNPDDRRIERSLNYLRNNFEEIKKRPYALALATNVFVNTNHQKAADALNSLKGKVVFDDDRNGYIVMKTRSYYGSYGRTGNTEVTALAAIAFAKAGNNADYVSALHKWLIAGKHGSGNWGSTQATVLALKALINIGDAKASDTSRGKVAVTVNGNTKTVNYDEQNADVMQMTVFEDGLERINEITIAAEGAIDGSVQVVKEYYDQWDDYEESEFTMNREMSCVQRGEECEMENKDFVMKISFGNNEALGNLHNVIIDIPTPAGLTPLDDAPELMQEAGVIQAYEIRKDRVLLYLNGVPTPDIWLDMQYNARFEGEFSILPARMYSYYDPATQVFSTDDVQTLIIPPLAELQDEAPAHTFGEDFKGATPDVVYGRAKEQKQEEMNKAVTELGWGVAKDDTYCYFKEKIIEDCNPEKLISQPEYRESDGQYITDEENIFFLHGTTITKLDDVDHDSFRRIGVYYAKDDEKVYFNGKQIATADAESFDLVDVYITGDTTKDPYNRYAIDENSVYYYGKAIPNSEPKSFMLAESNYGIDKNDIYHMGEIVSEATACASAPILCKEREGLLERCKDSDRGKNYGQYGRVISKTYDREGKQLRKRNQFDSCMRHPSEQTMQLKEMYCDEHTNVVRFEMIDCEDCVDGECLDEIVSAQQD
jgi:hypothetical protein